MSKSRKDTKKRLHKGKKLEAKKPLITVQLTETFITNHGTSSGGDPIPPLTPTK
jgi:hypothetical protein